MFLLFPVLLFAQLSADFTSNATTGCDYLTVNFSDLSTGAIKSWKWTFGNGNTSTLQNPTVVYSSPGKYTVVLTITDSTNNTSTITKKDYIQVYVPATVNFSSDKAGGCTPLDVSFSDLSVIGDTTIASWKWDLGDGNFNYQQNPSHTYTTIAGSYQVSLEVTDNNGCKSKTIKPSFITVTNPPISYFYIDSSQVLGCSIPYTLPFTNSEIASDTYLWNFGDGNTSSQQNTSNTYTNYGTYNISLTVTNIYGCSSSYGTNYWYVTIIPFNADFILDSSVICKNTGITFIHNSALNEEAWKWDFGDGNNIYSVIDDTLWLSATDSISDTLYTFPIYGTYTQPFYNYDSAGTYSVTLYAYDTVAFNNKRCIDTVSKIVTVLPLPKIDFTISDSIACMVPFAVQFTDNTTNISLHTWDINFSMDNMIFVIDTSITNNVLAYTYLNTGIYSISLTDIDINGCRDTLLKDSLVYIIPPDAEPYSKGFWNDTTHKGDPNYNYWFPYNYYEFSACAPATIPFEDVSYSNEQINYWHWTFGEPSTGSLDTSFLQTPSHLYADSGIYTGSLYIETVSGCKDSTKFYVYLGIKPTASFSLPSDTICHGSSTIFIDSVSSNVNHWEWHVYYQINLDSIYSHWDTINNSVVYTYDTVVYVEKNDDYLNNPSYSCVFKDTGYFAASLQSYHYGCASDIFLFDSMVYILEPHPYFTITGANNHILPDGTEEYVFCPSNLPPYTISLKDYSKGAHHWYWDFGDTTAGSVNYYDGQYPPPFTYAKRGNYTVTLTCVNDSTGCSDFFSYPIIWSDLSTEIAIDSTLLYKQCAPANLPFINASTSSDAMWWEWNFGDSTQAVIYNTGSSSDSILTNPGYNTIDSYTYGTYIEPVHIYNKVGNHTITLMVYNDKGCKSSDTFDLIEVYPQPSINFVGDKLGGCVPFDVNFTDKSISDTSLSSWNWNFGDKKSTINNTSILQNPTHTFADTGVFNIRLIVNDQNSCKDTLIDTAYITATTAIANFGFGGSSNCHDKPLSIYNYSLGKGLSYQWNYGDNTPIDTSSIPSHYYSSITSSQTVTVTLIVNSSYGCSDTLSAKEDILKTIGNFSIDQNIGNCPPFFASFLDSSSNDITIWEYDFGDGNKSTFYYTIPDTISHVYNNPGTYDVMLIVTNYISCIDTVYLPQALFIQGPQGSFSYSPHEGCPPIDVTFIPSNISNVAQYYWVFGDGYTSKTDTVVHTYDQAGYFFPTLIITDSIITLIGDTETCTITIIGDSSIYVPGPQVDFQLSKTDTACKGELISFINNTDSTDINEWRWYFGDGDTAVDYNTCHQYNSSGFYDVSLYGFTYLSSDTCIYYYTQPNAINIFQSPDILISDQYQEGCPPVAVQLFIDSQSIAYTIDSLQWNFNNQTSYGDTALFFVNNSDSFPTSLKVIFTNGCEEVYTDTFGFFVYPSPIADFSIIGEQNTLGAYKQFIQLNNTSQNAVSYLWNFGDSTVIDTTINPKHNYDTDGNFSVQLIAVSDSGCIDTLLVPIKIYLGADVPNTFSPNGDGINDAFVLNLSGEYSDNLSIEFFNRWGKRIYKNDDYQNNWDGKDKNNKLVQPDTYYYILKYKNKKVWAGWLRIIY